MRNLNFICNHDLIYQKINSGASPAIPPMLNLYRFAQHHHVAVFFITGRPQKLQQVTQTNLHEQGYFAWEGLFMKPENYREKSVIPYKSAARKQITELGYTIVANFGDQKSDLEGGYSEKNYKLPNPFYLIP